MADPAPTAAFARLARELSPPPERTSWCAPELALLVERIEAALHARRASSPDAVQAR
jgi:hypothetical protein